MTTPPPQSFHGVYAATLTPFDEAGDIDEQLLAAHFRQVMEVGGMTGVMCNGHAGENFLLSSGESKRVAEIAVQEIGGRAKVVCGVLGEATRDAVERARDAAAAGVDAVVIFPPFSWAVANEPEMIIAHHRAVSAAVDLPVILYMTSIWSGHMNYPSAVLERLVTLPNVIAIKEGSWDTNAYERTRALVKLHAPHVAVMASGDAGLFPSFVVGTEGSIVSLAVIAGEQIVSLYNAVQNGDHATASALHGRLQPLANAVYDKVPTAFAAARLKTAMAILGYWPKIGTRGPIGPLPQHEVVAMRSALEAAGLL